MLRNFIISPKYLLLQFSYLKWKDCLDLEHFTLELKTIKSLEENLKNLLGETTPNECEANEPNLTNFWASSENWAMAHLGNYVFST